MAAFSPASLPASIDTVEKLAMWTSRLLFTLYSNKEYTVAEGSFPLMQAGHIKGLAGGPEYASFVIVLPYAAGWDTATTPVWEQAAEIADVAIPASFTP